ncbi:MAG TPA: cobalt-precorrin-5B (C(1))-methyltransferase CbiD [Desulfovibrio sp.]|uniref:cobalt-precorrin-5B (C(1))-methyltransferase CbiD n=1 Tax=Desulfovibrio sp. TaxID=885 RepID=UPI002D12BCDF|nr:cobalt-precorrin-5B (C(1))-methyltransferase CbiD [Desulfovibrio sp.]HMM37626.1 cobalt-precorrin-5B (C(1))-methyltransferase CbiD [Desulfovibrio sp.]
MSADGVRPLREGFTTGTAAAAAAKAAALFLATWSAPGSVDVPLPGGGRLTVPVARCGAEGSGARAVVIKDAGDDPDVTDGAEIHAFVEQKSGLRDGEIILEGGKGIGRVTLPGLPVPPGQPAINPAPREQITRAVAEALEDSGLGAGARVVIEVPAGEKLAKKTMNARLGILGGISILGTAGIVRPYSHDSWLASIAEALDVARAAGLAEIVLTTGRRSERQWREAAPGTPELGVVQAADFFAEATRLAAEKGFARITWAVFFGKLVKQALGLPNTHAHEADLDFGRVAGWCAEAGIAPEGVERAARVNTARELLDLLRPDPALAALLRLLAGRAAEAARGFAGARAPDIAYAVFDLEGGRLL